MKFGFRYRVLDARDKLIRLTTSTTTDIARAVSTQGVCPDMCPEKERLMREATHHAATFELKENSRHVMVHTHALKQYARSSADQEFPLAHELRPEPVLQMTMQFLLHNIVGLCDLPDTNLGDWFHFVWDRTRSIRKDISQQELCSIGAVNLVEQCARLHIHCAGRLVAEEPQVFDSKINSENLTKCLQSLKYLYHDLKLRSVSCANEAEFRAYVVLLNLNDCQFFWEVKLLPAAILHSPEIQFAIKVYLALESNNYVRFFRLVRETTYMNACILLRYFTQVRVAALEMILKTYSPRSPVVMDLSYWQYVLGFEDVDQTALFFEYYGLQCDRNTDRVVLDRMAFVYPDLPFMLERAINLVEHKRNCSVGESINGNPLVDLAPIFDKYQPHDSFDEDGYLYAEAWTAEDQVYARVSTPKTRVSPAVPPRPPSPTTRQPIDLPKPQVDVFKMPLIPPSKSPQPGAKPSIFTTLAKKPIDVVDKAQPPTSAISFPRSEESHPSVTSSKVNRNIFAAANLDMAPSTAVGPVFSLNFGSSSSAAFGDFGASGSVKHNIFGGPFVPAPSIKPPPETFSVSNVPDPVAKPIPTPKAIPPQSNQNKNITEINARATTLRDELIQEVLQKETLEMVETEILRHQAERTAAVNQAATTILDDLLDEHIIDEIQSLSQTLLAHSRQTITAKYFHLWLSIVRQRIERRNQIANTPVWIESERTRADLSVPQQNVALSHRQRYRQGVAPSIVLPRRRERPIDVCSLVLDCSPPVPRMNLFWKCLLSIPDEKSTEESRVRKWITGLFQRRAAPSTDVFFCERLRGSSKSAAVCLRLLQGPKLIDTSLNSPATSDQLHGTHAVIFFASNSEPIAEAHSRLARLQSLNVPIKHVVRHNLSPHISTLRQFTVNALNHLIHTTLANSIPADLLVQRSTDFLLQTLGDQFWFNLRQSAASNPALNSVMRDPVAVVAIYNEAIEKLIQIVRLDHKSRPDFPGELRQFVPSTQINVPSTLEYFPSDWKDQHHTDQLCKFFTCLQLTAPSFPQCQTSEDLLQSMHDYCALQSDPNIADQIIRSLDPTADPPAITVQFAQIGPARLSYARLSHYFNKMVQQIPAHIVYHASELRSFCHQPWWLTFEASPVHTVIVPTHSSPSARSSPSRTTVDRRHHLKTIDKSEMDALIARTSHIVRNADLKIQQLREESLNGQGRRGAGAAQLDQHLRGYEQQVQMQKRLVDEDADVRTAAYGWQAGKSLKRARQSHQLDVSDIPDNAKRSFVWECYVE